MCLTILSHVMVVSSVLLSTFTEGASVSRIVGGFEAPLGYAGYHASLQNLTGHHVCGGALVSRDTIVTAAHCLAGADPQYVKIVVGTSHLDFGSTAYDVRSIHIHEAYNYTSKQHDIAVVKTKTNIQMNEKVEVIELYEGDLAEADDLILTGFGAIEANGDSSRNMYFLPLSVFSQETCQYAMRHTRPVFDTMFCTFSRIGQGTCHGDSGGPLVKEDKLAGLVSWGIPCAVGFPDVHTRITPYISWIRKKILSSTEKLQCTKKRST